MPDQTACAICHGPLMGRHPAVVGGKPAYLCARCFAAASRPPVGASKGDPPKGSALLPGAAHVLGTGPAHAGLCVGPVGIENFLNQLLAEPGTQVEAMTQVMVGVHQQPGDSADNGGPGEHKQVPVLLVTAVVRKPSRAETAAPQREGGAQ